MIPILLILLGAGGYMVYTMYLAPESIIKPNVAASAKNVPYNPYKNEDKSSTKPKTSFESAATSAAVTIPQSVEDELNAISDDYGQADLDTLKSDAGGL